MDEMVKSEQDLETSASFQGIDVRNIYINVNKHHRAGVG